MLMDPSELQYGELSYENRVVAFFDTLGWREEVASAGTDARRIARLAAITRIFSSFVANSPDNAPGARMTSFSDNVIVSLPYDPDILRWTLDGLATIQVGLALMGFWVRGALTVGNLFHDESTVFGPALNRAYELESKSAIYPRILIDPLIPELMTLNDSLLESDDSWRFIDPFNLAFMDQAKSKPLNKGMLERFNELGGTEIAIAKVPVSAQLLLVKIFERVGGELTVASPLKVWEKYAWLLDRIAPRIPSGVRSSNFTRPSA